MSGHHHFATHSELIYLGIDHKWWVANTLKERTRPQVLSDKKKINKITQWETSDQRIQFLQQISNNKLRNKEET